VRDITLLINAEVISEVTGIPLVHAIRTLFPYSTASPPKAKLMACFDPTEEHEWKEHKKRIPISFFQSPQRLLARIVLQNIWPISCNADVPLDRAWLIFAIINEIPFCMCKHIVMVMIEMHLDNQIALPFRGFITKILKKKLPNIPATESADMLEGYFGKGIVLKFNAQLHRFQMSNEPASFAYFSSSFAKEPSNVYIISLLTQMNDKFTSMDQRSSKETLSVILFLKISKIKCRDTCFFIFYFILVDKHFISLFGSFFWII